MSTKVMIYERGPEHKLLWEGQMMHIPRIDEWIALNEDQGGMLVHSVSYILDPQYVVITVRN